LTGSVLILKEYLKDKGKKKTIKVIWKNYIESMKGIQETNNQF
jgi:hypothetical protein